MGKSSQNLPNFKLNLKRGCRSMIISASLIAFNLLLTFEVERILCDFESGFEEGRAPSALNKSIEILLPRVSFWPLIN